MNIVLFTPEEVKEGKISLKDDRSKHILKILHKNLGDNFESGIVNKEAGISNLLKIEDDFLFFDFNPSTLGKPLYPLIMLIGFPRPIQLKRLFRDMASLGVQEIHLMGTELGEKSYRDSTIVERGTAFNLLKDGSIQAKSTHVPELFVHNSVKDCLDSLKEKMENNVKIILDTTGPEKSLNKYLANISYTKDNVYFAAIGSERGWTNKERELFESYNFNNCSMGERILRTETAATTAATIFLTHMEVL